MRAEARGEAAKVGLYERVELGWVEKRSILPLYNSEVKKVVFDV